MIDPATSPVLRPVLSVSELLRSTRILIERNLPLSWVAGEISNFTRAASGHCYFVLKDSGAQVRCVFFRNKAALTGFALREGMQVEVRALPTLYEARGDFQLNVEAMRASGAGVLYEKFARLKGALEARGWFAPERKRPLPVYPRTIGIVTSPGAAALRDVLTTLRRRSPHLQIVIYPCAGPGPRRRAGDRACDPAGQFTPCLRRCGDADRLPGRWLDRGPVVVQRRDRRAGDRRIGAAGDQRRRP
jgi:exodeoxyribonuclease VII large subunit